MSDLPLQPPVRVLLGPGPSDIHPRVLEALGKPTVGHLDPFYLQLMNSLQDKLRQVFQTKNDMTMAISGTGSAGMETTVVNLIEPGDGMIACINGVFGGRMADRLGERFRHRLPVVAAVAGDQVGHAAKHVLVFADH